MSRVTDLLGCPYPVIQGAMGVISNPELVAAVSEAEGFGLLATAFARDPEIVRDQAKATKQLTDKPFGANRVSSIHPGKGPEGRPCHQETEGRLFISLV